jgi:SAM-dependent methyltransferase
MSRFEKEYFDQVLLPSLKTVPFNYDAALKKILIETSLASKNLHFLDYGCGNAAFVKYLLDKGINAWGVDISSYSKEVTLAPQRHEILKDSKIPAYFGPGHYDLCFCCGVVQYMEEKEIEDFLIYISTLCDKIWVETLTNCSDEIPAPNDSHNRPLRTREWYNKKFAGLGFRVARVAPVYYRNGWVLERFKR